MCSLYILFTILMVINRSTGTCVISTDVEHQQIHTNCSHQGLTRVPADIPQNTTSLDLSHNNISILYDGDFQHLINLQTLELSINPINTIHSMAFHGLQSLLVLEMDGHQLNYTDQSLPWNIFEPLVSLTNLSYRSDINRFNTRVILHPDRVLWSLHNLTYLNIDSFSGTVFTSSVSNLTRLNTLIIGVYFKEEGIGWGCGLTKFKNNTFINLSSSTLRVLDLNGCIISELENGFLLPLPNLTHFYFTGIAFNGNFFIPQLLQAFRYYRGKNVTQLSLNNARYFEAFVGITATISFKILAEICIERLDISNSFISDIELDTLFSRYPWPPLTRCIKYIQLRNNYISSRFLKLDLFLLGAFSNLEFHDFSMQQRFFTGPNLKKENLFKDYYQIPPPFLCPPKLRHFDVSGWGSSRIYDMYMFNCNNLEYFNISYSSLYGFNVNFYGLTNIQTFDMSKNNLDIISPTFFKNLTTLTKLYLIQCRIPNDFLNAHGKQLFSPLKDLEILDLFYNSFVLLPSDLFEPLVSLKILNLAHNNLIALPDFTKTYSLTQVFVNYNSLLSIDEKQRHLLESKHQHTKQFKLSLLGNVFSCNCDALDFILWINETQVPLDGRNYTCLDMMGTLTNTKDFYGRINYYGRKCSSYLWMSIAIALLGMVTVAMLITFLLVKNKMKVRVFLLRFLGQYLKPRKREEFKYDAFIIYSDSIYQWVCHDLYRELETVRKLKLNIRDLHMPFAICEAEYISDSIRESWKTVFILNQDILQDDLTFFTMYGCLSAMKMTLPNKIILLRDCEMVIQANIGFFLESIADENIIVVDFKLGFDGIFWNELERLILKENFLQLDIFYREKSYEEITQQRAYDNFALFCDFGGSMGLFVGASVLTIFELLDLIIQQILHRVKT